MQIDDLSDAGVTGAADGASAPMRSAKRLVSVGAVSKSFGATEVLKGVDFHVSAGQIHALLGGNGAGKSTLIRIITGGLGYDAGRIVLSSNRRDRPVISVVHQELALLPDLTVAENIGMVHAASGLSAHRAKRAAGIAAEALRLIDPRLARTALHRKAGTLSLHESQIVEIARALSTGAEVLLLDEPTANLTASETERLFRVLRQLAREKAMGIVFVSHRMAHFVSGIHRKVSSRREPERRPPRTSGPDPAGRA